MLAEERFGRIVKRVNEKKSVTVQELMEYLDASESTVRRDLNTLDAKGEIVKVYGGAIAVTTGFKMRDDDISDRRVMNRDEKKRIAKHAASLIKKYDFVYIDAGTTTEYIIDFIEEKNATYVTNAVAHARKLVHRGFEVYLIGGKLKDTTEAIVGNEAIMSISRYNFTIGFWGANGIDKRAGFTTPDKEEAEVKRMAMNHCKNRYVLADSSKFGSISPASFSTFDDSMVITDKHISSYMSSRNIIIAKMY